MPIYRRTYRNYDGDPRRHFRWAIIVEQEIRVLLKSKVFLLFLSGTLIHFLLRLLQVVAFDFIMQDPNSPLRPFLVSLTAVVVNDETFFDFIRIQGPLVFVCLLFAGSGMICNDLRNHLTEIYFSKPLTWRDYALGKLMTLVFIGLVFTAVPAIFLTLLHNLMMPGLETIQATWWWPFSILGFSLIMVVPGALAVLASSSLLRSENYAGIMVFMLLLADSAMSGILAETLRRPGFLVLNYGIALNRVGEELFGITFHIVDVPWGQAAGLIAAVSALSLVILAQRVRRAEVPA